MTKKPVLLIFLGGLGLALLFVAWQPVQASVSVAPFFLKIMPFGDSITTSVGNTSIFQTPVAAQASYRYWLDKDLHAALIPFEFIGTQINNYGGPPKYLNFDRHNEAYSGWSAFNFITPSDLHYINNLLDSFSNGTTIPNVPDIVLLHLGHNDLGQGYSPSEARDHIGQVIDHFRAKNPNVIILLAKVIPCAPTTYYVMVPDRSSCAKIPDLNALIPGLAAAKNSANSPVIVVDQYTGFNDATDTYDNLHPNQSGEIKMANKWLAAIEQVYTYIPNRTFFPVVLK